MVFKIFERCNKVYKCFLDPALVAMVDQSVSTDGGESSYFEAPVYSSQKKSSLTQYSEKDDDDVSKSLGSAVPGTPERTNLGYYILFMT